MITGANFGARLNKETGAQIQSFLNYYAMKYL